MTVVKKYNSKKEELRFWILSGSVENWERGLADGIWGVRTNLKRFWDKITKGDLLIFYVTRPISGIVGFGRASVTFKQDKPLWADEIRAKTVIYPYRFEFLTEYCLPETLWSVKKIPVRDLKIGYWAGINPGHNVEALNKLKERISELWAVDLPKEQIPMEVREKRKQYGSLHNRLREFLYEIGKIDGFISEKEYPLDGERIDVAWRRVEKGVPSRVFEIQIGGDIYHALGKLKHAFDLWNSDLFLVIEKKYQSKVENLLSGTFHEIRDKIRVIDAEAIEELYELQIKDKNLKKSIGLL